MKPFVEELEIKKNNFNKGIFLVFTVSCIAGYLISLNRTTNDQWIMLVAVLFFGAIFWANMKYRILVDRHGISVKNVFRPQIILWEDINRLNYVVSYNGHSAALKLNIFHKGPQKKLQLSVKQFNKQKMQRFFEILNGQCTNASKNEHFIKQATGQMNWKDKLKMY